jgi:GxxExxY protein
VLAKYPWLEHHPHLNDLDQWKGENAVWVASPELQVEGLEAPEASGAGTLDYHEALVLTAREERRTQGRCTHWDLTAWWGREENGKFSKFNQPKNLISAAGVNRLLKTTGQWQELIVDTEYYPDLVPWINTTFSSAIRRDRSLIANHQTNGAADGRKADREFHPCQTSRAPHDLNEISRRVIGCAFAVSMALGAGFLEKVYENALAHELRKSGLRVEQQRPIDIWYDGILVGQYVADLVVEGVLLVEMKVVKAIDNIHLAQCLNYLKATGYRLCLLLNFANTKVEVKRIVSSY